MRTERGGRPPLSALPHQQPGEQIIQQRESGSSGSQLLQHGRATALRLTLSPNPNAKHASTNLARDFLIIVLSNVARRPRQSLLQSPGTPTANAVARGLPRLLSRPMQVLQTCVGHTGTRERVRHRRASADDAARMPAFAREHDRAQWNTHGAPCAPKRGIGSIGAINDRGTGADTPAIDKRIAWTRIAAVHPADPFRGGHACVLDGGTRDGRDD